MSVLVTGIGGNVGQGALRIIRTLSDPPRLVGADMILPCGGTHLCDGTYATPHATSPDYLPEIRRITERENVELILPCTDVEAYRLALADDLPTLSSPADAQLAFLDKYQTGCWCADADIPFASTCLPSEYDGEFESVVVKEREGRGSRGVHFDPPQPWDFSDDFVVQELLTGPELTIGFYVTNHARVNGFIVLERDLRSTGTTMLATVTRDYDAEVEAIVQQTAHTFDVRGSCNIQAKATDEGVVPFEVNGRISGSASIRHQFGYPDVEWSIREHLYGEIPKPPDIKHGTAVRLLLDIIYPDQEPEDIHDETAEHLIF